MNDRVDNQAAGAARQQPGTDEPHIAFRQRLDASMRKHKHILDRLAQT